MKIVAEAVTADGDVEEFGGVLGGAGAQAVQTQGVLVVLAVFAVLAAGVHLTEHQFPVVALFLFVPVHGTAAAEVFDFHGKVFVPGDHDGIAVAFSCFVDGVGEDLEHRMLAALQIVGTEDNGGTLAHPLLALEHGDAGIVILLLLLFCSHKCTCHIQ